MVTEFKILQSKLEETDKLFIVTTGKKSISSTELAVKIEKLEMNRIKKVYIYIGKENINIESENNKIVISNMNFSDQMYIAILYEQIYRAYKIINNESYHK